MAETERLLSVKDLQQRLGIGKDAAYALVASGEIPSIRLGESARLIRVRPSTLDAWLVEQEAKRL